MTGAPNAILVRYAEIGTKGANRGTFEQQLVRGIRWALEALPDLRVRRLQGRILVRPGHGGELGADELAIIREGLGRVFGLDSWSPVLKLPVADNRQTPRLGPAAAAVFARAYQGERRAISFRSRARRAHSQVTRSSKQLEIDAADAVLRRFPELRVDLDHPDLTLHLELREGLAFVFTEVVPGAGGLPTGSSGCGLALLSGGIDSPVAAWTIMNRGVRLHFITFHSEPYTPPDSVAKVARLAAVLNRWQERGKLLACNLVEAQKIIRDQASERLRTVLYRRLMMRVATIVAGQVGADALVTGEAVGQVASQTIRNLACISAATDMLILRPLAGADKMDVVARARALDSYEISKLAVPDSCTVFAPSSPATNVPRHIAAGEERDLDVPRLLDLVLPTLELVDPLTGARRPFHLRDR